MGRVRPHHSYGIGLVEILVVLAIAGIIMGVAFSFFSFQSRTSRETQARNEVQVRARAVAEAIAQDLKLAGARAVVDDGGRASFVPIVGISGDTLTPGCNLRAECVHVEQENGKVVKITLWYVSSLFLSQNLSQDAVQDASIVGPSCRRIDYEWVEIGNRLYRRDVACDDATPGAIATFANEFAAGIDSIGLTFICDVDDVASTADQSNPMRCYGSESAASFVREGQVSVSAVSERGIITSETVDLAVTMVNMRAPTRFRE